MSNTFATQDAVVRAFDRHILEVVTASREMERERIIKLFTEAAIQHDIETAPWSGSALWGAIALIKGENK